MNTIKHKTLVVLRCKVVIVGNNNNIALWSLINHGFEGDPTVGKTALAQVFVNGSGSYPKNYLMVRYFWIFLNDLAYIICARLSVPSSR